MPDARWASSIVALLFLVGCQTVTGWEQFHDRLQSEMRSHDSTSAAIVVVSHDRIVYLDTIGATPDSRFRVGSISKYVTSLIAQEVLDIDAPVDINIRSRFPSPPITPRLLMTHHSGLPSNILRGMYGTTIDFHDHVNQTHWLVRPAGAGFCYSDLGYTILGSLLEKDAPFEELARKHVFEPLGMTHSTFERTRDVVPTTLVENPPITIPANGLVTTPSDMAKLAMHVLTHEHPAHPAQPIDLDWRTGFGINMNDKWAPHAGTIYWHSGQTLGFTAEMVAAPKIDVAVVVMTNSRSAGFLPSQLAWEAMAYAIRDRTGQPVVPPEPRGKIVDDIAGTYPTEYGIITIGKDLKGRAFDEVLELVPTDRKTFIPRILAFGFLPVTPELLKGIELSFDDVEGHRALISHQRGLRVLRGVRIEPVPIPASWRAREGVWENTEQGDDQLTITRMELVEENGFLVGRITLTLTERPLTVPFTPLDERTAVTSGIGRYLGETVWLDDDGKMHVVGYALTKLQ